MLQIYGQDYEHEPVCIVGSKKDLYALRDLIENLLIHSYQGIESWGNTFFSSDGEGYEVRVGLIEDTNPLWPQLRNQYYENEPDHNKLNPQNVVFKLLNKYKEEV
jgi:hypothetical protein